YLTLINVAGLMDAVTNDGPLLPNFQQIRDTFFAVTGGQLQQLADTFYLVGGHRFDGIYSANSANPTQFYSNSIRKFILSSGAADMQVLHKSKIVDELNLHRRDYNLTPQIFPNGEMGLTAFSGVFQPGISLAPFLNIVEIRPSGHAPVNGFSQFLANYHWAKVPLWAQTANETHTLFFGGISNYWLDENDSLRKDNRLPFVKTVSRVSRLPDGSYQEVPFAVELPWYTGASAEFMLAADIPTLPNSMVDYDQLPYGNQLLGYIVGGIVTPDNQPNPFVANTVAITSASTRLIKVFLEKKNASSPTRVPLDGQFNLHLAVSPNPASDHWKVSLT
ncbi:MAG: T9SS C-terminal target domain-containing protein, partial [Saprospiraceae bacterium]|nr:T9SS C-terminal target domain-containing protein [Saprospiraceae bacterium]